LRVLGAAVAVLVAAWLAFGLRSAVLQERGVKRVAADVDLSQPAAAGAALAAADNDLRRARQLSPDPLPLAYRAQVLALGGRKAESSELINQALESEPDSFEIWKTAAVIGQALKDPALTRKAATRLRELSPQGAIR
jgi:predicted Zn-dependent protease